MARRRQRFADLERQLRNNGGQAAPDSLLGRYAAYKRGERKANVKRPVPAAERKRYAYAILPFNLAAPENPTNSDRYAAPITQYSERGRRRLSGITALDFGYADLTSVTQRNDNFYPALLKVKILDNAGAAPENEISGITGRPYKVRVGKSYSIPFGRKVGEGNVVAQGEENRRRDLAIDIKAVPNISVPSIGYEPEIFRIGNPDPGAVPENLPGEAPANP